jgi:signal transduction histidine kinase
LADSRQVKLEVITVDSDSPEDFSALGDTDRLAQIFDNLLDNAIRHAPAGSAITVTLQRGANEIQCTVKDQGSGIPPEHLPYIFERFYRVESARDRNTGGSGLGLAIVHSLVLAQGGRVIANNNEDQGTMIIFWLPSN